MTQVDVSQALYAVESAIAGKVISQDHLPAPRTVCPPYELGKNWPPNYGMVYAWRRQQEALFEHDPDMLKSARAWYAGADLLERGTDDPAEWTERCAGFINHWCDTYDPRNAGKPGKTTRMPLVMFEAQEELIEYVLACMMGDASGLVEKSRDMGATWTCVSITTWLWVFSEGTAVGWGANKLELVDILGDPDTILEKQRAQIRLLPDCFRPPVTDGVELKHKVCRNPLNGSVVSGQGGKDIGRGGRRRLYFVDEAAHLENAVAVEAALSQNTRCRIDVSSVNLPGTVFDRKRIAGEEWRPGQDVVQDRANVFVMDWSDHPEKTPDWYASIKRYYDEQGTPEVVAREIDRNPMGAAEGVIIHQEWVLASLDAHVALDFEDDGGWWGALDVADTGLDTNALVRGRGVVVKMAEEWGARDPGVTARRTFNKCRDTSPIDLQYDCIGLGTNVKSEMNRIEIDEGIKVDWMTLVPWSAAAKVLKPAEKVLPRDDNSATNKNYFQNFKAQAWWNVARKFYKTWVLVEASKRGQLEREGDTFTAEIPREDGDGETIVHHVSYEVSELISIDTSGIAKDVLTKLKRELSQATMGPSAQLKMMVNKAPEGAKSPNLADALIMGRYPAPKQTGPRPSLVGAKVFMGGS